MMVEITMIAALYLLWKSHITPKSQTPACLGSQHHPEADEY